MIQLVSLIHLFNRSRSMGCATSLIHSSIKSFLTVQHRVFHLDRSKLLAVLLATLLLESCYALNAAELVDGKCILSDETVLVFQKVEAKNLVPGAENSIEIILVNKSKESIEFTEITASCGCVAAEPIEQKLNPGEEVSLKIKLRSLATMEPATREVKIIDDRNRMWQLAISCVNIAPFESFEDPLVFEDYENIGDFKIKIKKNLRAIESLLKATESARLGELKVRGLGVSVDKIGLAENENYIDLEIRADPRSIKLLGQSTEMIEIQNSVFKMQLPIVFKGPRIPRISPRTLSRYKLTEGLQRMMVLNVDGEKEEIGFRGVDENRRRIEVDAERNGGSDRVQLYNLSSSYDKIKECRKIEVYSRKNPDTIFAVLEVIE
ncbi:MAG: DUF1573 domain-containing protein [Planctomycetota bacterium]|nr:DUF1573 domain-containing protein [Planctomycetota bacterium]